MKIYIICVTDAFIISISNIHEMYNVWYWKLSSVLASPCIMYSNLSLLPTVRYKFWLASFIHSCGLSQEPSKYFTIRHLSLLGFRLHHSTSCIDRCVFLTLIIIVSSVHRFKTIEKVVYFMDFYCYFALYLKDGWFNKLLKWQYYTSIRTGHF